MSKVDEMRALREKKFAAMQAAKAAPAKKAAPAAKPAAATPAPAKTAKAAKKTAAKVEPVRTTTTSATDTDLSQIGAPAFTTVQDDTRDATSEVLRRMTSDNPDDRAWTAEQMVKAETAPTAALTDDTVASALTDDTVASAPTPNSPADTSPDPATCTAVDKQGRTCSRPPNHPEKYHRYVDANDVPKPASTSDKSGVPGIREWARANGYDVGDRGRLPAEIKDAYAAAYPGQ